MRRVCVESPFAGNIDRNIAYADACLQDCFERHEAAFLGHLLYPRVLDDGNAFHRERGIAAHCAWLSRADAVVAYVDLGISDGMKEALALAAKLGIPREDRELGKYWPAVLARAKRTPGF